MGRHAAASAPRAKNVRRHRGRLLTAVGTLLVAAGLILIGLELRDRWAYHALSQKVATVVADASSSEDAEQLDWPALLAINPDVAAWIRVDGTDISLPVVAPSDGDMDYYLHHDLWGSWSVEGTPFLDARSTPKGAHRLVYGHHLLSGGQFSALQRAADQTVFKGLGTLHWQAPTGERLNLTPLCALAIEEDDELIQRFSFADDAQVQAWLTELCQKAGACTNGWEEKVAQAQVVVTLSTCRSELPGQSERTVVIFIS